MELDILELHMTSRCLVVCDKKRRAKPKWFYCIARDDQRSLRIRMEPTGRVALLNHPSMSTDTSHQEHLYTEVTMVPLLFQRFGHVSNKL